MLGAWMCTQRARFKKKRLSDERVELLLLLRFDFAAARVAACPNGIVGSSRPQESAHAKLDKLYRDEVDEVHARYSKRKDAMDVGSAFISSDQKLEMNNLERLLEDELKEVYKRHVHRKRVTL